MRRFGEREPENFNDKNLDNIRTKHSELVPKLYDFDRDVAAGNLPSLDAYRQICLARSQAIRYGDALEPSNISLGLLREAERLQRAADGDAGELSADALRHADFFDFLARDSQGENRRDFLLSAETWRKLATLAAESEKRNQAD